MLSKGGDRTRQLGWILDGRAGNADSLPVVGVLCAALLGLPLVFTLELDARGAVKQMQAIAACT